MGIYELWYSFHFNYCPHSPFLWWAFNLVYLFNVLEGLAKIRWHGAVQLASSSTKLEKSANLSFLAWKRKHCPVIKDFFRWDSNSKHTSAVLAFCECVGRRWSKLQAPTATSDPACLVLFYFPPVWIQCGSIQGMRCKLVRCWISVVKTG